MDNFLKPKNFWGRVTGTLNLHLSPGIYMQRLNRLGAENQIGRLTIWCRFEPQMEHNYRRILLA